MHIAREHGQHAVIYTRSNAGPHSAILRGGQIRHKKKERACNQESQAAVAVTYKKFDRALCSDQELSGPLSIRSANDDSVHGSLRSL
jgi:hypothetical protein